MLGSQVPSFLDGTFDWEVRGYQFASVPPTDLLAPSSRSSDDPWVVVAACLQQAKLGRFVTMERLRRFIRPDAAALLVRASVDLLGDVATKQAMAVLLEVLAQEPDAIRVEACWGCHLAGYLLLIPPMVEAWRLLKRQADRDSVGSMFSQMLEEGPGPLSVNEEYSPHAYAELVLARYRELAVQLGGDNATVWEGRPFSVTDLAIRKRKLLANGGETPFGLTVEFTDFRHRFEASTGIDCSTFFYNEVFRPLAAAAILDDFLEGPQAAKFEPGVRYFFGHRIPD
jgi:hypothetical protein